MESDEILLCKKPFQWRFIDGPTVPGYILSYLSTRSFNFKRILFKFKDFKMCFKIQTLL